MKYRFYIFGITKWAQMHSYFFSTHNFIFRVNKSTRVKLIKDISFYLGTKIFKLCNFCFEMHHLFITKADRIAKREAFCLKRD